MSCPSAVYACNTSVQAITADTATVINFGSVIRAYGPSTSVSGGNVTTDASGYYVGDINVTLLATAAGTATIQILKDGVAVPGATATVTTAVGDYAISIPFMIRNTCCCESTITAVCTSSGAATISNAAILVRKM